MSTHDRDLCVCFHVSRQKIIKYIRLEKPAHASGVSECYGAGSGCGYCIPFIREIHEAMARGKDIPDDGMSLDEYLAKRKEYHRLKKTSDRGEVHPELVLAPEEGGTDISAEPPPVESLTDGEVLKDEIMDGSEPENPENTAG